MFPISTEYLVFTQSSTSSQNHDVMHPQLRVKADSLFPWVGLKSPYLRTESWHSSPPPLVCSVHYRCSGVSSCGWAGGWWPRPSQSRRTEGDHCSKGVWPVYEAASWKGRGFGGQRAPAPPPRWMRFRWRRTARHGAPGLEHTQQPSDRKQARRERITNINTFSLTHTFRAAHRKQSRKALVTTLSPSYRAPGLITRFYRVVSEIIHAHTQTYIIRHIQPLVDTHTPTHTPPMQKANTGREDTVKPSFTSTNLRCMVFL